MKTLLIILFLGLGSPLINAVLVGLFFGIVGNEIIREFINGGFTFYGFEKFLSYY